MRSHWIRARSCTRARAVKPAEEAFSLCGPINRRLRARRLNHPINHRFTSRSERGDVFAHRAFRSTLSSRRFKSAPEFGTYVHDDARLARRQPATLRVELSAPILVASIDARANLARTPRHHCTLSSPSSSRTRAARTRLKTSRRRAPRTRRRRASSLGAPRRPRSRETRRRRARAGSFEQRTKTVRSRRRS